MQKNNAHRFAVAPMIDWTDRHCRFLHRLLTKNTLLFTEMITTGAILHGNTKALLAYHEKEHPVALQLGGSDPRALATCASIAEDLGYDEINLNVGCPSDRVQKGRFGACLMAEPNLIGDCIAHMQARVQIPITVKTRIGIDHCDEQTFLWRFVETVASAGCQTFIIHARKAWLQGLSPKENREIPPLNYPLVYELKKAFPHLWISLNGGLENLIQAKAQLLHVDGVMLGRAAYYQPYLLSEVDSLFFGKQDTPLLREAVLSSYLTYSQKMMADDIPLHHLLRPLLGLWHGQNGSRKIRQILSDAKVASHDKIEFLKTLAEAHEKIS